MQALQIVLLKIHSEAKSALMHTFYGLLDYSLVRKMASSEGEIIPFSLRNIEMLLSRWI